MHSWQTNLTSFCRCPEQHFSIRVSYTARRGMAIYTVSRYRNAIQLDAAGLMVPKKMQCSKCNMLEPQIPL